MQSQLIKNERRRTSALSGWLSCATSLLIKSSSQSHCTVSSTFQYHFFSLKERILYHLRNVGIRLSQVIFELKESGKEIQHESMRDIFCEDGRQILDLNQRLDNLLHALEGLKKASRGRFKRFERER